MIGRFLFLAVGMLLLTAMIPGISCADIEPDLEARVKRLEGTVIDLEMRLKAQGSHIREHEKQLKSIEKGYRVSLRAEEAPAIGVAQQELEKVLDNLAEHMGEYRSVPYFRGGKVIGLRIFAVKRESILEKYGIRNGDILLSVDGQVVDPNQHAKELLVGGTKSNFKELLIERSGEQMTLKVPIRAFQLQV